MTKPNLENIAPAFLGYLKSIPENEAMTHLWDCLKQGGRDNEAWKLWEAVHGDKAFSPKLISKALYDMVKAIQ